MPKSLSYDEAWTMIQENNKLIQEKHQEYEKEIAELREQIKQIKKIKKLIKQNNEQTKKSDNEIAERCEPLSQTDKHHFPTTEEIMNDVFGKPDHFSHLAEKEFVHPDILDTFNELNYGFTIISREARFWDENHKTLAVISIMLESDDFILCIDVHYTPDERNVREHIEQLKFVHRHYKKRRLKEKKIIGAIGSHHALSDEMKNFIIENGLYIVVPFGNTFKIDVPENFQPRIFYGEEQKNNSDTPNNS